MERCGNRTLCVVLAPFTLAFLGAHAHAQEAASAGDASAPPAVDGGAVPVEQRLNEMERQLRAQQQEIAALKLQLSQAQDGTLASIQGLGLGWVTQNQQGSASDQSYSLPGTPVGEAPATTDEEEQFQARVQAVPEGQGVLTPKGVFQIEPSIEYVLSSSNRLVFRGIELVPGLQIGVIEASRVSRDTFAASGTMRYGVTDRLEAELRVPLIYRHDRIEVVQQRDEGIVRTLSFRESNIGDVEFGLRYQLNRPTKAQQPIFVAGLRVKSDTGKGPFDIGYDEFGIATGLTTGSGFWAVQPTVNFLLPSDPVVIYGGASYLFHIGRDVDKIVGGALIGHVDPGDAISANLGFGFALNPRFSFSLGYRHSYIFSTKSEIGDTFQRSDKLQVGSAMFGMSYRLTERQVVNFAFEFGVTEDAPDVAITIRVPFSLSL